MTSRSPNSGEDCVACTCKNVETRKGPGGTNAPTTGLNNCLLTEKTDSECRDLGYAGKPCGYHGYFYKIGNNGQGTPQLLWNGENCHGITESNSGRCVVNGDETQDCYEFKYDGLRWMQKNDEGTCWEGEQNTEVQCKIDGPIDCPNGGKCIGTCDGRPCFNKCDYLEGLDDINVGDCNPCRHSKMCEQVTNKVAKNTGFYGEACF